MSLRPLPSDRHLVQAERLSARIGVARELALTGASGPARQLCGSIFLDELTMLANDEVLLGAYVECLLLLEMTALLPRVVQAMFGIEFSMMPLAASGPRRWVLTFGRKVAMVMPASRGAGRGAQQQAATHWGATILSAAAREAECDVEAERVPEIA